MNYEKRHQIYRHTNIKNANAMTQKRHTNERSNERNEII